jgi:sugar phosphate isomerase/epimerase
METAPRILFSTGALYLHPLRAAFELASAAGCDGVELDVSPASLVRSPRAIARLAAASGMPVAAVHPPLFPLPGWKNERQALPRLIDLALATGARTIVIHPPKVMRLESTRAGAFAARLTEARRRLEGTGTQVTIENPGFFRRRDHLYAFWRLPALRRLAEQCGVGITLDTTHAGSSPFPLMESYGIVRGRLAHIHLSDLCRPPRWLDRPWLYSYVKHHQLPGAGDLPLELFVRAALRDGFRGDITLELSPTSLEIWSLARAREHLADAVAAVRRWASGKE